MCTSCSLTTITWTDLCTTHVATTERGCVRQWPLETDVSSTVYLNTLAIQLCRHRWEIFSPKCERERNVLFIDALNTFYLRLYGVRHMVTDHSDSEQGNPLPPHRLLLSINSKGSFICTYHSLCYTSRGALAGTRNSSMGPPHEGSIRRPIAPWANALTSELCPAPSVLNVCSNFSIISAIHEII